MLEAAWWGFIGGASLILGALAGIFFPLSHRVVGLTMGFGAGVLISAVAFELTAEAYVVGGAVPVVLGLYAGALTFYVGDLFIDRRGGDRRKSPMGPQPGAAASALVLGALLDGIPESAAIGISLVEGGTVGAAMVAAVFISNLPEALSASAGLKTSGMSSGRILAMWTGVTFASTVSAALGYAVLGDAGPSTIAVTQAFAAGAILTMLADTMLPEAVQYAGRQVGLVTVLGFVSAFLLSVM